MIDDLGRDPLILALVIGIVGLIVLALALIGTAVRFRVRNNRTGREWSRRERTWDPLILMVLSGAGPDLAIHESVAPADRLYFIEYLLRYARRLEGPERAVIERIAEPYLGPLVNRIGHRDEAFRARAIRTVGTLGQARYRDVIVAALDDPSDLVAMAAARSLTQSGSPALAAAVLAKLSRFGRWRPSLIASMLVRVGPAMAEPLRAMMADASAEPAVRVIAVEALAELSDPLAADAAARLLAGVTDRNLVVALLGLVFVAGRAEHLEVVRPLVASPDAPVRARAYATVARLDPGFSTDQIAQVLRDESPWVPIRVVEALESIGARRLVAEINAAAHRA